MTLKRMLRKTGLFLRRPSLAGVITNISWLMVERVILLLTNLAVSIVVARYLGPAGFGIFQYALAFVALFGFLPYLGLDSLVTRHLVEEPEAQAELVGTTLALRIAGGAAAAALAIGASFLFVEDALDRIMIAIIACGMIFDATLAFDLFFQSRLQSRHAAVARTIGVGTGAILKIACVLIAAPLEAFAGATLVQQIIQAVALVSIFGKHGLSPRSLTYSRERARSLLSASWPLMISSLGGVVFLKIDQVMLKEISGNAENGIYAVAARLSEVWWFLPTAIGLSLYPMLVRARGESSDRYAAVQQGGYDLMFWIGTAIAVAVSLVAGPAIALLYGNDYVRAADVLIIHIWISPIMFMGAIASRWLVLEGLQMVALSRSIVGAVVNVGLNLWLIPLYGAVGAAVATVASYSLLTYGACLLNRATWPVFVKMSRAPLAPFRVIAGLRR